MPFRILAIGEVLWDLLPAGPQLGGAPANFVCHARALGADAALVSRVGNDPKGREVLRRFARLGIPTETIGVDDRLATGTVTVDVADDGQPSYQIHENVAWDFLTADSQALAATLQADAVYFGTLGQRTASAHRAYRTLLEAARPSALKVFDINLRAPIDDPAIVLDSLGWANVLKLNDSELTILSAALGLSGDPRDRLNALARRFQLRAVALTRGDRGSLLLADGCWSDDPGRVVDVEDAIGCGDAFAAVLTLGLLQGRHPDEINRLANDVAAFVCSQAGATPSLPEELRSSFAEVGPVPPLSLTLSHDGDT